jgi:hypothetical protein
MSERHRGSHRREMACVRAPSLVGRRETTVPRIASGSLLMRSSPLPYVAARRRCLLVVEPKVSRPLGNVHLCRGGCRRCVLHGRREARALGFWLCFVSWEIGSAERDGEKSVQSEQLVKSRAAARVMHSGSAHWSLGISLSVGQSY